MSLEYARTGVTRMTSEEHSWLKSKHTVYSPREKYPYLCKYLMEPPVRPTRSSVLVAPKPTRPCLPCFRDSFWNNSPSMFSGVFSQPPCCTPTSINAITGQPNYRSINEDLKVNPGIVFPIRVSSKSRKEGANILTDIVIKESSVYEAKRAPKNVLITKGPNLSLRVEEFVAYKNMLNNGMSVPLMMQNANMFVTYDGAAQMRPWGLQVSAGYPTSFQTLPTWSVSAWGKPVMSLDPIYDLNGRMMTTPPYTMGYSGVPNDHMMTTPSYTTGYSGAQNIVNTYYSQ